MCNNHSEAADKPQIIPLEGMHRRDIVRGLAAGTLLIGAGSAAGCASVGEFFQPSSAQLQEMSAQAWAQTKAETPISKDANANRRLQAIGQRLIRVVNYPGAEWEFVVFDSNEKNAWVLPGGKVGFYKGLMDFVDNDDQIAAVMGHEIGHVTANHAAQRMGQQSATSLGLSIASIALGGAGMSKQQSDAVMAVAGAGASVGILLPFSRENESEADILGVEYMHAANYKPRESVRLWEKMAAASASRPQEWMSTHPDPNRRARVLDDYITSKGWA